MLVIKIRRCIVNYYRIIDKDDASELTVHATVNHVNNEDKSADQFGESKRYQSCTQACPHRHAVGLNDWL